MEQNENGRLSSLGLLKTMTALHPKFHYVSMACDDRLTIQTHKVMLVDISTVFGGSLRKHSHPYPLAYKRGGGTITKFRKGIGIEDRPLQNKIDTTSTVRTHRQQALKLWKIYKKKTKGVSRSFWPACPVSLATKRTAL